MKKELILPVPIYTVDAFTDKPFKGNPAAVCFLTAALPRTEAWMQQVAAEMNLSETAFFRPIEDGAWHLQWFTPNTEVDLCGHATLATAHVIWSTDMADPSETLRFHTRSGILEATRTGDIISLDFPSCPATEAAIPAGLEEALGARIKWFGLNGMDALVLLENATAVRNLDPDLALIKRLDVRGVIVTALADAGDECDFVSRFFGPKVGVDEDPVTGSAHCCLAPFWMARLGKSTLLGYQASKRGGFVTVQMPPKLPGRVLLQGKAVTVLQGVLSVPAHGG